MKKAFDQTVRDIRRGVNKKVLKVPSIEQKVLDATSNEPWGPHGTHLADIAQASRNYHEYQMIMSVIWKRINDTGKNWRHVYKALTVLEYLVANGSERIVDDIREHAYQISTLSTFQYIDSNGRDQGSNVRKKSQSLVAFVNDKERIQEVRQKAAANRDKYRSAPGGLYRPGTGAYEDDRYEDRNGYGDPYGRDGGRYSDDHYGRDGYRDDEYRGRSRSVDGDYGPRSRSSDRERERAYEDDGHYSSRGSNAKADDRSQDGSVGGDRLERKFSEQNLGAPLPPSYEDAVGEGRSPVRSERNGDTANINHQESAVASKPPAPPSPAAAPSPAATPSPAAAPPPAATATAANLNNENDGFDLFDPRGSIPAALPASGGAKMDLLGSLSDSLSSNALALVPSTSATSVADAPTNSNPGQTFVAPSSAPGASSQPFDDPFGDGPFRAIPSSDGFSGQPQSTSAQPQSTSAQPQSVSAQPQSTSGSGNNFGFGESFNQNTDILADILPPSGPTVPSQNPFQAQPGQFPTPTGFPNQTGQPDYMAQPNQTTFPPSFPGQFGQPMPQQHGFQPQGGQPMPPQPGFLSQGGQRMPQPGFPAQGGQPLPPQPGFPSQNGQPMPPPQHSFQPQGGQQMPPQPGFPAHQSGQNASLGGIPAGFPNSSGQPAQPSNFYGGFQPAVSSAPATTAPAAHYNTSSFYQQTPPITASTGALAIVPQQPPKEKFETKSTVWADTLNRGLVNLNISGSKTNPLSDIGIDFEAINRKEKRMEKPSKTPVTSNVSMGKAMGSGTGIGRAGAGALRAAPNPMTGPGMAMGAPSAGPGYGPGYAGVNQPIGMNNMGQMQQPPAGFLPGSGMAGIYNPAMGRGSGYGPQPYGGYR